MDFAVLFLLNADFTNEPVIIYQVLYGVMRFSQAIYECRLAICFWIKNNAGEFYIFNIYIYGFVNYHR